MGRRRSDENLREVILAATERLLGEDPSAVTSRAVQAASGVSSGTFFHYFPTVDDLLLAVATRAVERQPSVFGDPATDGADAVLGRLFDPNRRDVVLPWLRQRAIGSPELKHALRHYDAGVAEELVAGVRAFIAGAGLSDDGAGLSDDFDVRATVEVVRALAEGFQLRLASDTLAVEPQRFVAVAIAMILRGTIGTGAGR